MMGEQFGKCDVCGQVMYAGHFQECSGAAPKATRPTPLTDALAKELFDQNERARHYSVSKALRHARSLETLVAELVGYAQHADLCPATFLDTDMHGNPRNTTCTCDLDNLLTRVKEG